MIELSSRLHIKDGNQPSIILNDFRMNRHAQALIVSVGNSYAENQIMHTFLDNFHQSGKYSSQLASHQAELTREEKYPDQKCLNISSLKKDYLNIDNSLSESSRQIEKAKSALADFAFSLCLLDPD